MWACLLLNWICMFAIWVTDAEGGGKTQQPSFAFLFCFVLFVCLFVLAFSVLFFSSHCAFSLHSFFPRYFSAFSSISSSYFFVIHSLPLIVFVGCGRGGAPLYFVPLVDRQMLTLKLCLVPFAVARCCLCVWLCAVVLSLCVLLCAVVLSVCVVVCRCPLLQVG